MVVFVFYTGNTNAQIATPQVIPKPLPTSQIKYNSTVNISAGKQLTPWQPKAKEEVVLKRSDVAKSNAELMAKMTDPSAVHSLEDLSAFTAKVMKGDDAINYVKISATITEIDYSFYGRLLGIFPFHPITRTFVDSKHKVRIQPPWYRLILGHTTDLDAKELQKKIDSESATMAGLRSDLSRWALQFQVLADLMKVKGGSAK